MASTEAGHAANRVYTDQDGDLHLNGANLRVDESGTVFSATEIGYLDAVTPGTIAASKAAVADANGAIGPVIMNDAFRLKKNTPVAAAGAVIANAAAITGTGLTKVTGADNTVGVQLSSTLAIGEVIAIASNASGKILKIYPPVGGQINEGGANAAFSTAAAAGITYIVAESNTSAWAK